MRGVLRSWRIRFYLIIGPAPTAGIRLSPLIAEEIRGRDIRDSVRSRRLFRTLRARAGSAGARLAAAHLVRWALCADWAGLILAHTAQVSGG